MMLYAVCSSVGHRSACSISRAKTSLPNATHERNCTIYSEKHKISSWRLTLHFLKSGVGIAGSHSSARLKISFSSDLLSVRSAAGVGVDVEGPSAAVRVATLWIGAGGGGGTFKPVLTGTPGDRDIGSEDGKVERGNSGLSPKPEMDTPNNPSDDTLCGAAHRSPRRNLSVYSGIQIFYSRPQGNDFSSQSVRQRDSGRLNRSTHAPTERS